MRQCRQNPALQGIRIDDDANVDGAVALLIVYALRSLLLGEGDLSGQTQQQLPHSGCLHRLAALDDDVTDLGFQGFDPLADRRLRDVQLVGGRIEASLFDDALQRQQLFERDGADVR